jgi:hypothetical protein
VKRIWEWTLETEYVTTTEAKYDLTAGWEAVKMLGVTVSGQARASHAFTKTIREKQRQRFSELMSLTNQYLANCYEILSNTAGQPEWLIIIEELDKTPNLEKIKEITTNPALFPDLEAHIICNIPQVAKAGERLTLEVQAIYDVPIFQPNHQRDPIGIDSMRRALAKRVHPGLFAPDQIDRLVIASGGNFRTLFRTVDYAGIQAFVRLRKAKSTDPDAGPISDEDTTRAINNRRAEYRDRLGESGWDDDPVPIKDKLERLRDIYDQKPYHDMPDKILSKLLQAGAVQVFNGTVRLTVHPLVVDILVEQGLLTRDADGFIAGGSI